MFKIKSRAIFALCLVPALCLGGCQKKEAEAKNPDPSKLASQLLSDITFQDKLEAVSYTHLDVYKRQYPIAVTGKPVAA